MRQRIPIPGVGFKEKVVSFSLFLPDIYIVRIKTGATTWTVKRQP
jgi:hypothetical protein